MTDTAIAVTNDNRRQIKSRHRLTTRTKHNPEKPNNAKYNSKKPGLVASYDTRPGNEVGLFYNAHEPTRGAKKR